MFNIENDAVFEHIQLWHEKGDFTDIYNRNSYL